MQKEKKLYMKFPVVLREKLKNGEINFPTETQFTYEPILVYRAVSRESGDFTEVNNEDFKSYFALNKMPKKIRGVKKDIEKDPHYYGVSSFLQKEIVEQKMKMPNPKKKMAVGHVYCEAGPQETNLKEKHVCWWLYENVKIEGFTLMEENKNE